MGVHQSLLQKQGCLLAGLIFMRLSGRSEPRQRYRQKNAMPGAFGGCVRKHKAKSGGICLSFAMRLIPDYWKENRLYLAGQADWWMGHGELGRPAGIYSTGGWRMACYRDSSNLRMWRTWRMIKVCLAIQILNLVILLRSEKDKSKKTVLFLIMLSLLFVIGALW